ncbi:DUF1127 domain-containing protein [Bradyrhizobium lablabi]|uniref:DUF1127 domain-containing protein n=1 Tax=Bradyrhizobium lablabi TaxID=722472 RepID=UPI003908B1AE
MLSNIAESASPVAIQRSVRLVTRGIFRVVNNFVAYVIAQREHQANLAILRRCPERDLRDIGLSRSQLAGGLVEAAKERARLQKELASRK